MLNGGGCIPRVRSQVFTLAGLERYSPWLGRAGYSPLGNIAIYDAHRPPAGETPRVPYVYSHFKQGMDCT